MSAALTSLPIFPDILLLCFPHFLQLLLGNSPSVTHVHENHLLLLRPTGCNVPIVTHEWRGQALFQPFQGGASWGEAVNEAGGMGLWGQAAGVQLGWAVYWWRELPTLSSWSSTLNTGSWSKGLSSSPSCLLLLLWQNVPALESGWPSATLSAWGVGYSVGAWSPAIFFSSPASGNFLCPPSSQAFSFYFLIAFSSLKNLPPAYQKLWLLKVLFQMDLGSRAYFGS